jgi:hypothetical protein
MCDKEQKVLQSVPCCAWRGLPTSRRVFCSPAFTAQRVSLPLFTFTFFLFFPKPRESKKCRWLPKMQGKRILETQKAGNTAAQLPVQNPSASLAMRKYRLA